MQILTDATANTKTAKTADQVESAILHLLPASASGYNVCPFASPGCTDACLNISGRSAFDSVQEARLRRTLLFFEDRAQFWDRLTADVDTLERRARRSGLPVAIRLNGTSDIAWERLTMPDGRTIIDRYPSAQFYDYTKRPGRTTPKNYHLTFSLSEINRVDAAAELAGGRNVAVVFKGATLPDRCMGAPVIDGDASDLRYLDPSPAVVGLRAKGRAIGDASGFAVAS